MKRIILFVFLIGLLIGGYAAWNVFGPTIKAPEDKYFYVHTGDNYNKVRSSLIKQKIIQSSFFFDKIAVRAKYDKNVKPGRYEIKDGASLLSVIRMLKSGS